MSDLHACAAKQVVSSPWGAPLLGSPSPFAESHAKDAPRQIPSKFRTSPLSKIWGQQVVIENRGGAGTNIGNEMVSRSDPDGYTVLFATASLAVNRSLYRSLSYDPIADFAPVSLFTQLAYFVFVPNSSPAHSIKELIDHAKSRPGMLTM